MDRYFGFDLGDAESAISRVGKSSAEQPEILTIRDVKSIVTAYALLQSGEVLVGESACYTPRAVKRAIRFKSRFLKDPESRKDLRRFAVGILGELYGDGNLLKGEDCSFYIGCPAGWDSAAREDYRALFEEIGYPPARIISESRAALVAACQSKHLQVGYDILSKPVLVVDIGSSTTDFAYIASGKEVELKTAGEVALGGGMMDEILLETALDSSPRGDRIRTVFEESEPWKNYCEFAVRRLKENYFSDVDYWSDHECTESVMIRHTIPMRLKLTINPKIAHDMLSGKQKVLDGRSFRDMFMDSLKEVRGHIDGEMPELVFLTGGVSRMQEIRGWVREVFSESVVITGSEPEFTIARGLASCGRIDEDLREFREELNELISSTVIEDLVRLHIDELYRNTVETLVDPVLENAALPVFDRWRSGEIRRLEDVDGELEREIEAFLQTEEARSLLVKPIMAWLKPLAVDIEEYTVPICTRHNIPYQQLSLTSYLSLTDIDIRIEAKDVFAVGLITLLIDTLVSVLIGLLCGGSGVALISSGAPGIMAGAVISLLVLVLGKNRMEQAILSADIPNIFRKMVTRKAFESRMDSMSSEIRDNFYRNLETEKNEEITGRMVSEISEQIEQCLSQMAEIVEIPLG